MGAIASGGVQVLNHDVVRQLGIPQDAIRSVAARELEELQRREKLYRNGRPEPDVRDKTVILVDDGLATGSTMRAAIAALRKYGPRSIVLAVPVGAPSTCEEFREEADEVVCAIMPLDLQAVGLWYHDFSQTTEQEIESLLDRAAQEQAIRHGKRQ
jgi:putative phosphoribosyl transferase